ncbi:MAG: aminopeptidase [Bacteroidetes bacterium]|nr:MAG: aminopeptidase [Bacteroidota bacterium]
MKWLLFSLIFLFLSLSGLQAQEEARRNRPGGEYLFTVQKEIPVNGIEDQGSTSTCWSFSSLSFLESELLRMGKGSHDFAEMFIVRHTYEAKADLYVRMHGQMNFGPGGAFHDVPQMIARHGIVPESVYEGLRLGYDGHRHGEMDDMLKALVDAVVKNPDRALSPRWREAFAAVLDAYLGPLPETFEYQGETYTPQSFAASLGLDTDDYVELTSYTHHPYYSEFVMEVPDNWNWSRIHNLPLDDLIETIDYALENDYTVAWAADVSEKTFSWQNGVAIVPETDYNQLSASARDALFQSPQPEKTITPELRQAAFDNYQTTDDHGMHIVGLAHDQHGTKYYIVKNSWGESNYCGGYLYASEAYVRYKTMDIMLHREAIPKRIRKQLGMK